MAATKLWEEFRQSFILLPFLILLLKNIHFMHDFFHPKRCVQRSGNLKGFRRVPNCY